MEEITTSWDTINGNITICAYPVSGAYGNSPRYLYFFCLFVGTICRGEEWIVRAMFGGAMLYSSITALHALAILSFPGSPIADLDAIPMYAITVVGLCNAPYLIFHAKLFRGALTGTRIVVYSWLTLMMVGSLASVWNVHMVINAAILCSEVMSLESKTWGHTRLNQDSGMVTLSAFTVRCLREQAITGWVPPPLMLCIWVIGERRRIKKIQHEQAKERRIESDRSHGQQDINCNLGLNSGEYRIQVRPDYAPIEQMSTDEKGNHTDDEGGGNECRCCCGHWGCSFNYMGTWKSIWYFFLRCMMYVVPLICLLWQLFVMYIIQRTIGELPMQEELDAVGQWGPLAGTVIIVAVAVTMRYAPGDPRPQKRDVKEGAYPSKLQRKI